MYSLIGLFKLLLPDWSVQITFRIGFSNFFLIGRLLVLSALIDPINVLYPRMHSNVTFRETIIELNFGDGKMASINFYNIAVTTDELIANFFQIFFSQQNDGEL